MRIDDDLRILQAKQLGQSSLNRYSDNPAKQELPDGLTEDQKTLFRRQRDQIEFRDRYDGLDEKRGKFVRDHLIPEGIVSDSGPIYTMLENLAFRHLLRTTRPKPSERR